jgi:hypothetical protein
MLVAAAMLKVIQDAGEGVLVLVDDVDEGQLLRSRLTRAEVQRQLLLMAGTLGALPPAAQAAMPEIDWAGWRAAEMALSGGPGAQQDDALCFATRALVPATLSWLRVYRQGSPELFSFTA